MKTKLFFSPLLNSASKVRAEFPNHTILAGNVVTGEMVEELILSGADIIKVGVVLIIINIFIIIIKVGIGPGSVCTTRKKTGVGYPQHYYNILYILHYIIYIIKKVGYPQLSAVLECADAAHGLGGHIISDGGCTCPGDVAKAFGAGADFVMMGGMLAGHDQSGGEVGLDNLTEDLQPNISPGR